ncbi:hypothetical protein FRC00_005983 [Tulasnella sp. 408]|nr:hypothetical protein FRC00_005983 [Tulasnella sp. 408]
MDTECQLQQANSSVPIQSSRPNPHESTEHIDKQKQKQKRGRESDPSSAESDDSSSDIGPEELEIIEQQKKELEQEQKALKKRIRQLAQLASKGKKTSISDSTNKENNEHNSANNIRNPSNNLPMGSPSEGGSVGQQTASHPSSTQPIRTREPGHLPTPTEPQARDQDVGDTRSIPDRLQPDVQLPGETASPQNLPDLPGSSHHTSSLHTSPSTINQELIYDKADLPEEPMTNYGQGVHVPQAEGLYATKYYPNRDRPLKMPTGMVTKQAYAFRYNGLESAEVMAIIQAIQDRAEECPAVYHHVLKSSAKGNFDAQVHWWFTPIFRNYHLIGEDRQARSRYLRNSVLPDLFRQFPDLHPDYIKVQDTKMERAYLDRVCNTISSAYHQLRPKLAVAGRVETVDKEIIKWLTEPSQPPRPHDLWARDQLDSNDANGKPKKELSQFAKDWQAKTTECLATLGAKTWVDNRLSIEQEFRKAAFAKRPEAEKDLWNRRANAKNKPVDKMTALIRGFPFATHVLRRFSDIAEVPIAILIGAPDPQDSSKLIIYHDTFRGPAPAHIEDFWSGPNQLGTSQILPQWRRFVANVYEKSAEAIHAEPQPLPEFVLPSEDAPAEELPERVVYFNGIRFVVTPPPDNWCIRSPERDDIISNLRTALSESWKETFGKGRIDFSAIRERPFDFTCREYLPQTLKRIEEGPGGTLALVNAREPAICLPCDPRNMDVHVLEAWYLMFVDDSIPENRRFRWVNKGLGRSSKDKRGQSVTSSSKSKKGPNNSKKGKGKAQSEVLNPRRAPRFAEDDLASSGEEDGPGYPGESETSAGEGPTDPRLRAPTVSKSGRISSAPQILAPLNSGRNRMPSPADMSPADATRTANDLDGRSGEALEPGVANPLQTERRLLAAEHLPEPPVSSASQVVLTSPQKDSPTRTPATDIHALFTFHPPNDQYPIHLPPDSIDQINSSEYFRHIPSPNANAIPGITLPHLSDLIIRCVDLDLLFPVEEIRSRSQMQTAPKQPQDPISTLWAILENPDKPLPGYLFTLQTCQKTAEPFISVLEKALQHLSAQLEALEGCNLCTTELGSAPRVESWTTSIIITARFLGFLYSIPRKDVPLDILTQLAKYNARLVEIVCMYLAYRYTSSTVARFMASYPNATSPPTIASTVQSLGIAWLNSTSTLLNPLNKRRLSTVIDTSRLQDIERGLPFQELPFFELQDAAKRWLVVERTDSMEDAMTEFALQVTQSNKALERLSIYEQFVVVAVIIGRTLNPNRSSSDKQWLLVVESIVDGLGEICGTSQTYEKEYAPAPPPPTMAPCTNVHSDTPSLTRPSALSENRDLRPQDDSTERTLRHNGVHDDAAPVTSQLPSTSGGSTEIDPQRSKPKHYSRPKSRIGGRTRWVVGDVIEFPVGGVTKKVRIRQKGPNPKALIVTWLESREPVLSSNGAPIPLPAFNPDLLVTPGPAMPALDLDCFIREQPLPPFIPFEEILTGKHDDYFRELFAMYPDDPPLSPESDHDDIRDLPDDLRLKALEERISRRRSFRDLFCLPPDSQDLEDEADVQSLLGSAAQGPSHQASSYARPDIPDFCTAPSDSRRDASPSDPRPAVSGTPAIGSNTTQDLSSGRKPSKRRRAAPTASDNDSDEDEPSNPPPEKPSPPTGLPPRRSTRPKNPPPAPVTSGTTKGATKSRTAANVSPENTGGEAEAISKKGGSTSKGKAKSSTQGGANASHQAQDTSTGMKTRSRSTAMQGETDMEGPPSKKLKNRR